MRGASEKRHHTAGSVNPGWVWRLCFKKSALRRIMRRIRAHMGPENTAPEMGGPLCVLVIDALRLFGVNISLEPLRFRNLHAG